MKSALAAFSRFGAAHLTLARHAAIPLGLTPDLLYWLWATFPTDEQGVRTHIPWIAVSDLLLSPLCRAVRAELFEMEGAVRAQLTEELVADPRFGRPRAVAIAAFLQDYVQRNLRSPEPDVRALAEAQCWTARAHLRPDVTAAALTQEMAQLPKQDKGAVVRMSALVAGLAHPLAGHPSLQAYGKALLEDAHGIEGPGGAALADAASGSSGGSLVVSGVTVPIPQSMHRVTERRRQEGERLAREAAERQRQEEMRRRQAEAARIAKQGWEAAGQAARTIKIYIVKASPDELLANELMVHLQPLRRQGLIELFSRDMVPAGELYTESVRWVDAADIVLVLVSAYLLAEWDHLPDLQKALARQQREGLRLIPVIGRPCIWQDSPLRLVLPLPRNGRPVSDWQDRDEAWTSIVADLRPVIQESRQRPPTQARSTPDRQAKSEAAIRVLFLAANPGDLPPLELSREMQAIQKRIQPAWESQGGQSVALEFAWEVVVRPSDLASALLRHRPDIVHFTGHSAGHSGLVFDNDDGKEMPVPRDSLGSLFRQVGGDVRCVVLNACWSHAQAEAIAESIDCVVGTDAFVRESEAITIPADFYQALSQGRSIAEAFRMAMEGQRRSSYQSDMFHLVTRRGVYPDQISFGTFRAGE